MTDPAPDPQPEPPSGTGSDPGTLTISLGEAVGAVDRADWDRLANPPGAPFDPFLSWDFLQALEESGCVGGRTGWQPRPLLARDASGALVGAVPCYVKLHSQGEYIFDHAFADAWERAGGRWYPKLTAAVPFTPVTGRRLLAATPATRAALAQGLRAVAEGSGLSTVQVNFPDTDLRDELAAEGWQVRTDRQFHFVNSGGWHTFDDFLGALSSEKRKNLRKERARAVEGLTVERLTGADLTEAHWDFFFACYMDTGSRKWGSPYLNRAFFALVHARMADKVVLILAREDDRPIACALNFVGSDALYGRYWGRVEDRPFLHFELCYYQAIDEALARGLPRVEAGAQGGHKLARGYGPVETYQAFHIPHEGLRAAVARYLEAETEAVRADNMMLECHTPFRKATS